MSDEVDTAEELTPDDARRAALLATVNTAPLPATHRVNPYALALGWIAGILLAVGVLILLIAASQASDQPYGVINLAAALTGAGFAAFGLITLLLLLAIQLVRWSPPVDSDGTTTETGRHPEG